MTAIRSGRPPAEQPLELASVGDELGRVAGAPRRLVARDGQAAHALDGLDDGAHGVSAPRADVGGEALAATPEVPEREQVRAREVDDVHVVAHGRAVGRRVVGAEELQRRAARRRRDRERDEVALGRVVLAELAVRVGARGVEVAQRGPAQAVGVAVPVQHALDEELRVAVRVERQQRVVLGDGHLGGAAVDGRRRREHDVAHAVRDHGVEQVQRAHEVVAEVLARVAHGLAHLDAGRELDDGRDGVRLEDGVDGRRIGQVALDERAPAQRPAVARRHVVEHDGLEPRGRDVLGRLAADEAGAPDDQDRHARRSPGARSKTTRDISGK
jgi:hypothetical protein